MTSAAKIPRDATKFLTGLRGYSALGVYMVHAGGGLRPLSPWLDKLVDFGKYGVIVFFFLSALSLSISINNSDSQFTYRHYLLRRFARIFPMYCLAIVTFWLLDFKRGGLSESPWDITDLILHLSFLNLFDTRYINSIIGPEWSVPIEMAAYLFIPFLYFLLLRLGTPGRLAVLLGACAIPIAYDVWFDSIYAYFDAVEAYSTVYYLHCFIAGIAAFSYWRRVRLTSAIADVLVVVMLMLIVAVGLTFAPRIELSLSLLMIGLVLALSQARLTRFLFENRAVVFIGNISFSFYLLHLPIVTYLSRFFEANGNAAPNFVFVLALVLTGCV